ncbi:Flp pilus assembly protein CpaB [Mitsuokella jalaludinii]|uniref:Flp pilus assembly protein CpaB n=2 Tax=Mitsuokella jalaludinii TaxID=187979 RepID=UPI00242CACF9|nr:Flp pilus assembly protein CpaB [Mitsuokella jalaludinii]MCI6611614.1 Flp pilus assembly protein CpaB [Mitsuokella jalaludinii]
MANQMKPVERIREFLDKITYRQWVVAAGVVSILLGLMVYFAMSGDDEKAAEKPQTNLVQVVAAKQDIPERTVVKEDMLKVVEVPSELVPEGAFRDVADAVDHPTSTAIQQGDIMTSRKVYVDIRMAGFTGIIPPDCRAVTIPINDVTGVSGFAHPGDYVDIMIISGTKENGINGRIILQDVLLLGINRTADLPNTPTGDSSKKDGDKKDDASAQNVGNVNTKASSDTMATATVALKPADALKLAAASQEGTLYLVLRPFKPRDMYTFDTDYAGVPQGNGQQTAAPSAPQSAPAPAPSAPQSAPSAPSYSGGSGGSGYSAPSSSGSSDSSMPVLGRTIEVIRGVTSTREGVK